MKSRYKRIVCKKCMDYIYVGSDSVNGKAKMCTSCFNHLSKEEKQIALDEFYIPCVACDGQFYQQNYLGELENCDQCNATGRHKVTKEEYDKFWRFFSKDDFI
ncbi:hypothetical protein PQE70_gp137 [Bacillus phage vB_BanS_Nate]|uniref:Uncharacterized protein n=1 Tax=Bacillus phage vB_BanS_Nate TaxID=2894788 RepID=A0AAE8YUG2_9CAUD|nr:hypothetical protein PQE70_gp137 [Bacillus phage vB_BanS_Nate]UGO50990.1 hypothetical protein NATE_137 [Bacillus phage vB_BanS_Nate]